MELKKISKEELGRVLELHEKWLNGDVLGVRAFLGYMDLRGVNLRYKDLSWVDLRNSDLREADLSGAILGGTNLSGANLENSDLSGTNLGTSCLIGTNLKDAKYDYTTAFLALQCPEEGSFIGYKKSNNKIVKLRIEEDSLRSSSTSRKCRASKVTVLSITSIDGTENFEEVSNTGWYKFTYEIGKTYEIEDFDKDRWNEDATGIHFFITRDEAVRYQ